MIDFISSFSGVVRRILFDMAGEEDNEKLALFSQCRFIVVRNETLKDDVATAVCSDRVLCV